MNINPINANTNFCSLIIYAHHISCVCGSPQPYFSHTILILHNTVWSHGIFQECNPSQLWSFAALPFKTVHLKYMFYSCAWCEDSLLLLYNMPPYLKKDFAFLFIKIAFPVLHHNIYFSLLLCSISSFDTPYYSPTNNHWRREIVIFLGWLACKSSTRAIKMNLRRPHALIRTLYKIISYSSQTKINPPLPPIQTIPSLQVSASHQFPPTPLLLIFSCRIKFNLS